MTAFRYKLYHAVSPTISTILGKSYAFQSELQFGRFCSDSRFSGIFSDSENNAIHGKIGIPQFGSRIVQHGEKNGNGAQKECAWRIRNFQKTAGKSQFLDLSGLLLKDSEFPKHLNELKQLRSIDLGENRLTTLPKASQR